MYINVAGVQDHVQAELHGNEVSALQAIVLGNRDGLELWLTTCVSDDIPDREPH